MWHLVLVTVQLTTGSQGVCTSSGNVATVLDRICSAVIWCLLDTHSSCLFPLHCPSHRAPYAISYQSGFSILYLENCSCYLCVNIMCTLFHHIYLLHTWKIYTFTAIIDLSRFNNSWLKSLVSTLVDLIFQSRSFSFNQLHDLSLLVGNLYSSLSICSWHYPIHSLCLRCDIMNPCLSSCSEGELAVSGCSL